MAARTSGEPTRAPLHSLIVHCRWAFLSSVASASNTVQQCVVNGSDMDWDLHRVEPDIQYPIAIVIAILPEMRAI